MKTIRPILALTLAAVAAVCLAACASIAPAVQSADAAVTSPAAQPYIQAAALVAVGTAEAKGVTAAQITDITQIALAANSSTAATLQTVANAVNQELGKLNLPAQDILAAQVLEDSFAIAIQQQIGSNATVAQTQAAVNDILQAILSAANPTGVPVPKTTDVPAQNRHFLLASVESPQIVGASASLVLIACLQAFAHISINAPTGAAVTVLFTASAALIDDLIG